MAHHVLIAAIVFQGISGIPVGMGLCQILRAQRSVCLWSG
jgi:hypothetical protein